MFARSLQRCDTVKVSGTYYCRSASVPSRPHSLPRPHDITRALFCRSASVPGRPLSYPQPCSFTGALFLEPIFQGERSSVVARSYRWHVQMQHQRSIFCRITLGRGRPRTDALRQKRVRVKGNGCGGGMVRRSPIPTS